MEEVVSVVSREMVMPAKATERQTLFLSCFDIIFQDIKYNQRVLFYKGVSGQKADHEDGRQAMIHQLKSSLALCLVHYYPWCGRIAKAAAPPPPAGQARRLVIDCNDAGVEFVEASSSLPISHLSHRGFQMTPFVEQLCQHVDHSGDCLFSSPLLSIQATLFSDGGLAIGITQSHIVVDGHGLWSFMVSWGECSRGVRMSLPPMINRERLALPHPSLEKASWTMNSKIKEEDREEDEQNGSNVITHSSTSGEKPRYIGIDPSTHKTECKASKSVPLVQCERVHLNESLEP